MSSKGSNVRVSFLNNALVIAAIVLRYPPLQVNTIRTILRHGEFTLTL